MWKSGEVVHDGLDLECHKELVLLATQLWFSTKKQAPLEEQARYFFKYGYREIINSFQIERQSRFQWRVDAGQRGLQLMPRAESWAALRERYSYVNPR